MTREIWEYWCPASGVRSPKVNFWDIPEERRYELLRMNISSVKEEELEEWIAVHLSWESPLGNFDDSDTDTIELYERETVLRIADGLRERWRRTKEFNAWKKKHLAPLEKELVEAAKDPQFDWQFLYDLEYHKLVCMNAYMSHGYSADSEGCYKGKCWMEICIRLLDCIRKDGSNVTELQVRQMNIRNVRGIVSERDLDAFVKEDYNSAECNGEYDTKVFWGRRIYVRKMERLYHAIRLYKTRLWWC